MWYVSSGWAPPIHWWGAKGWGGGFSKSLVAEILGFFGASVRGSGVGGEGVVMLICSCHRFSSSDAVLISRLASSLASCFKPVHTRFVDPDLKYPPPRCPRRVCSLGLCGGIDRRLRGYDRRCVIDVWVFRPRMDGRAACRPTVERAERR